MTRLPLRLTPATLATYRPGGLVAVALGAYAGIPAKRPRPRLVARSAAPALRTRAFSGAAGRGSPVVPAAMTAIVPVRGALEQRASIWDCGEPCAYDTIEEDILEALSDPGVGQAILDVDSPGGDVPGLEQAILRIRAGVVALGKPLLGYVNEFAASAALWLMLGVCDGVYLPPSARMGSIGSVVIFGSDARRLAKEGTDIYVGRDPGGKMNPNPLEALDALGKARIDRLAAEGAGRFYAGVEALREIPAAELRAWNGEVFTGQVAADMGIADGVFSLEQTIALAESWPRTEAA